MQLTLNPQYSTGARISRPTPTPQPSLSSPQLSGWRRVVLFLSLFFLTFADSWNSACYSSLAERKKNVTTALTATPTSLEL